MSFAFEATMQPDGTYIMIISGKEYRCRDWEDVCRQYHEQTERMTDGKEEHLSDTERI